MQSTASGKRQQQSQLQQAALRRSQQQQQVFKTKQFSQGSRSYSTKKRVSLSEYRDEEEVRAAADRRISKPDDNDNDNENDEDENENEDEYEDGHEQVDFCNSPDTEPLSLCPEFKQPDETPTSWWLERDLRHRRQLTAAAPEVERPSEQNSDQTRDQTDSTASVNLPAICGQLLTLVCALLLILYLIDFLHRKMTNLFSKILANVAGDSQEQRRRSLAAPSAAASSSSSSAASLSQQPLVAQSRSSACLASLSGQQTQQHQQNLKQDKFAADSSGGQSRRASRSSIHSLFSALTGAIGGSQSSPSNNGNVFLVDFESALD